MRYREINQPAVQHDNRTMLSEAIWFLPALAAAVRVGAPMVARMLSPQGAKAVAKVAGTASVNVGKAVITNPAKVAAVAGGAYTYKTVNDAITAIQDLVGTALDQVTVENLAMVTVKYALPAAAVVAVLYGGKKLYDYLQSEGDAVSESAVANYYWESLNNKLAGTPQMKFKEINQLNEARNVLFESVIPAYHREIYLGEQLAIKLTEAALTADQIQQLFTQVQQQATASGANKTAIGKGVDAAKTVAKAYAGLKELAQNSGPVKGFDAAFDKVAAQLKQYTGGDQGAMKYVERYRNFATQYPVAQKVIYGALVMAVGVAAAGALGPAGLVLKPAVIGLMRVTDKLLQGEKFSAAAIAGAETFAAGKIAQWAGQSIQNVMGGGTAAPVPSNAVGAASDAAASGTLSARQAAQAGLKQLKDLVASGDIKDYESYKYALDNISSELESQINPNAAKGLSLFPLDGEIQRLMGAEAASASGGKISGGTANMVKKFIEINGGTPDEQSFATGEKLRQQAISQMQGDAANMSSVARVGVTEIPLELRSNKGLSSAYQALINKIQSNPDYNVRNLPNDIQRFAAQNSVGGLQATKDASALSLVVQKAGGGSMKGFLDAVKAAGTTGESLEFNDNSLALTESQVKTLFRHIEEGPLDVIKQAGAAVAGSRVGQAVGGAVKSAAGAIGQKIATGAENLTTKVTADKLNRAWKTAGSPMDSVAIYKFLQQQGIDDAGLKTAFKSAGITAPRIRAAASPAYNDVMKQITVLSPADQQKLVQYLKQDLAQATA